MMELTESQKVLLQPIASALGCAADPDAILVAVNEKDTQLARLGQAIERHAQGLLAELGKTSKDIVRWYVKQAEKMQKDGM